MIGTTLSHYRILDKLGAGGMGEVYLAEDTRLRRQIALKVLPHHLAGDPQWVERFKREAEALAALDHPNIVTVYTVEETGGIHFLTMQLVKGQRLTDLIPRRGMPLDEIFEISIQTADALAAAHAAGIIHRDLKPSNIMVSDDGRVRILDFGVAKLQQQRAYVEDSEASTESLTSAGRVLGTAPYMSPEQLEGRELDASSDIFSLGVILSQMATGRLPFSGDTPAELLSSIMRDTPSAVSDSRAGFPDHLDRILQLCLQKDRRRRMQSAHDVRNELEHLRDEWIESSRDTAAARRARPPRRWTWLVVGGAMVALLIAALASLDLFRSKRPQASTEILAVMPFAIHPEDDALQNLSEGLSAGLIHKLSEIRGLQLISRTEAWSHYGPDVGLGRLAEKLGVTLVVEGEIQQAGDSLQVHVSVNDPLQGILLWSESFEPDEVDIFRLQREIAAALTRYLSISLSASERRRLDRDPTQSAEAYSAFVQGQKALDRSSRSAREEAGRFISDAIARFEAAIRVEPEFALAHAGLSQALWRSYRLGNQEGSLAKAEAAARQALDLDPDLPAAQVAAARVQEGVCQGIETVDDIYAILPGHPRPDDALRELAVGFDQIGDLEEASACYEAATKLASANWSNWNAWGAFLIGTGRYDEADQALAVAVDLAPPGIAAPRKNQAGLLILRGDFENAIAAFEQMKPTITDGMMASNLGTAYFFSDREDALEKAELYYRLAVELDSEFPAFQGNLGDLLLKTGRGEEAMTRYRLALELIDDQIDDWVDYTSPNFEKWRPLAVQRAFYAAKAEDCTSAIEQAEKLRAELPPRARDLHNLAYVFALCDEPDAAIDTLSQAIGLGVSRRLVAQEDEFRSLRELPEFQALLAVETSEVTDDGGPDR